MDTYICWDSSDRWDYILLERLILLWLNFVNFLLWLPIIPVVLEVTGSVRQTQNQAC